VITGSVPDDGNTALRKLRLQVFDKGDARFRIPLFIGFDYKLVGVKVECAKVSLLLSLVEHGDFDALVSFAPHIAANISPIQMTLIYEQDHAPPQR
jgi:hypothetical protein